MEGNHPKRRREKDNPYWIYEKEGAYYISFEDGQKITHKFELPKYLYDAFNSFELEDLKYLNVWERHYERMEVWESTINTRAFYKQESLEENVFNRFQIEMLHKAIKKLSETQQRRIKMYYFDDMTYEQIAEKEGCTKMPVKRSIDDAIQKLKKELQKN